MAQKFGKVRYVRARKIWEIDARPHGRFRSIPVQGAKDIPLSSEELAESVLAQIRAEIQSGKSEWAAVAPYLPRATSTVDKVVDRWCEELRRRVEAKEIAPRTLKRVESYKIPEGHFSWLYSYSVYEITPGHLSDWNLWLMERDLHQNTRKHVVETMRTVFRWLQGRGELENVPRFPTVSKRKHVPNVIPPEDQERVLEVIREAKRGIYIMAVEEVFRPGELRALNVADYDVKSRTVTVRHAMDGDTNTATRKATKEEDVRVRQVTDRMAAWLDAQTTNEERLKGSRPLFVNADGRTAPGGRYNAQALRLGWRRAAESVGLGHVGMYEGTKHSTLTEGRGAAYRSTSSRRRPDTRTPEVPRSTPIWRRNRRRECSGWHATRARNGTDRFTPNRVEPLDSGTDLETPPGWHLKLLISRSSWSGWWDSNPRR